MTEHRSTSENSNPGGGDPSIPVPGITRLRDQHEAVTRRTILSAARPLFAQRGFGRTTVKDIAAAAGVAVQTIYSTFGSKGGVLAAMVDLLDEESGVADLLGPLQESDDPNELVALYARAVRLIKERTGDIVAMLSAGAAADDEVDAVWQEGMRRRHAGLDFVIGRIEAKQRLPRGMDRARAADIAAAMVTEEPCDVLVRQRGWTFDAYEQWLAATLSDLLLGPQDEAPPSRRRSGKRNS